MQITIANEVLLLLPQRVVYWPARRMLVIADIHFGKAASFRALGVPVPAGTTTQNLATILTLMTMHEVQQIVFLGDFLHARAAHATATLAAIRAWRNLCPNLTLTLVRGNHDDRAGDPPADLDIAVVDEPYVIAPFAFCHHPQRHDAGYVMAGHIHPVHRLASGGDALRLPCFVIGERGAILPSFGAFTGGHAVTGGTGEQLYVVADDHVFAVPAQPPAARRQRMR
jgi:DNA ligase-associated metallophosphoesterase